MKNVILIFFVITMLAVSSGCSQTAEKTNPVNAPVKQQKNVIDAYGAVKCTSIKDIVINFPATINTIDVKEGQRVNKNQTLATLDISEYQAQIKNKEMSLKALKDELANIKDNLETKGKYLANNSSPEFKELLLDLEIAEEDYNKFTDELNTKDRLYKAGSIPQQELEDFKATVDDKKNYIEKTKLSIESFKYSKQQEIDSLKESNDSKAASISVLEDEIATMKARLKGTCFSDNKIFSDIETGLVYDIKYMPGNNVSQSLKLLSIMDLKSMAVIANVSEEFIKDVKKGANVSIIPLADKSKHYKGKVINVSDKAINQNGETNIVVEISIDDNDGFLLPEFNVNVEIDMLKLP